MTDRLDPPAPKRKRRRATTPPGHTATAPASVGQGVQVETISAAAGPAKRRAPRKRAGKAPAAEIAASQTAAAAQTVPPMAPSDAQPAKAPSSEAVHADPGSASPQPLSPDDVTVDSANHAANDSANHAADDAGKASGEPTEAVSDQAPDVTVAAEAATQAAVQAVADADVVAAAVAAHAPQVSGEAAAKDDAETARHAATEAPAFEPSPTAAVAGGADQAHPDQHDAVRASLDQAGTADASAEQNSDAAAAAASDGPSEPRDAGPPPPPHDPHHRHGWVYAAMAVFVLSLLFGAWGVWTTWLAGDEGDAQDVASLSGRIERLNQEVSTLRRSDLISRDANRDLQRTLAERDEEIAGLRADVAFYERFVGATGQRRGLSVHDLEMQLQSGEAWHFVATLTQNLNRGAVNTGRLTLSVEGTRNERMERLSWTQLRRQNNPPGAPYSFKYFQQVEGDVLLPKDFKPVRVIVRLTPAGGAAVEQSFTWNETQGRSPTP